MCLIRKVLFFVFFTLIIGCSFFIDYSYAQRAAAAKRFEVKPNAAKRIKGEKAEKAERAAKARSQASAFKIKKQLSGGLVSLPIQFLGVSGSMSSLAANQSSTNLKAENGPLMEDERYVFSHKDDRNQLVAAPPAFMQTEAETAFAATAGTSFEGPGLGMSGYSVNVAPSDSTLAVGPNHIVAWVNSNYAVFDKSGNKLLPGNGFVPGNSLFASLGTSSLCAATNRGDPILQYDRLADRWILSQFAFLGTTGPYLQCIAVSTSGDPTGQYYLYSFALQGNVFNDYGKLGIWTDAYYISYVVFTDVSETGGYVGAALCAYDKAKMMAGQPATSLCGVGTYGGAEVFLPIDMDGTTLPSDPSQGGIFAGYSMTSQALQLIKLKPDFENLTGSLDDGFGGAFGSTVSLPVGATTVACNGSGATCIAQPGTANQLDSLGDRLMYRLAYRNRGGVESLLVNQAVDPDGAGSQNSAIRWYEVRNPFGNPADADMTKRPFLYQNATYNPGAAGDRWMGSMAMDKFGNILMGYSIADTTKNLKPSIAVTGRLRDDPLNTMQAEMITKIGTGSQIFRAGGEPLSRWGDYTTMQVDPSDDATFWYIGQYLAADGVFNWNTRISSYKFTSAVGGSVAYGTDAAKFVPNVSLVSNGDMSASAFSGGTGTYSLNLSTSGTYTVTPSKTGEVNGITPFDAVLILRHLAAGGTGANALSPNQRTAADVSGDGNITPFDATLILRYTAAGGSNANFGQVGKWKFTPGSKSYPSLSSSMPSENYTAFLLGDVNGSWIPPGASAFSTETPSNQKVENSSKGNLLKRTFIQN